MNYSEVKKLLGNDDLGLNNLSKQQRKKVLKDTILWLPGFKDRLKKKVERIIKEQGISEDTKNIEEEESNIGKEDFNIEEKPDISENMNHGTFDLPPEDSDEYIPQDIEMGESMGEGPHIFEISPYLPGYYTGGKKSYFDKNRLIWSKRKKLQKFNVQVDKTKKKYSFAGKIGIGIFSIPLSKRSFPDKDSLVSSIKGLEFKIDQNNCIYLESKSIGEFAFEFYIDQYDNNINPIREDSEKIIKGNFKQETRDLLQKFKSENKTSLEIATILQTYINKGKKYNEKAQGKIFNSSNKNNYFVNLDKAESLECYSSNTLFVGLLRELGVKSRLVVGHHIQAKGKNGKSNIGQNTGHAWSEVRDEDKGVWVRFDATPTQRENDDKDDSGQQNSDSQDSDGDNEQKNNQEQNQDGESHKQGESGGNQEGQNQDKEGQNQDKEGQEARDGESNGEAGSGENSGSKNGKNEGKTPEEILEEMIEKVEQDDFNKQEEELNKQLEQVKNTEDKNELKKLKEKSDLTKKAKKILEEEIENKIFEKEKEEIQDLKDENQIDEQLKNSILDNEFLKDKLRQLAKRLKKKIEEERKKKEVKMKDYGFRGEELVLFNEYLELENEVKPEIKRNIRKLEKLLPKEYKIIEDDSRYFSGKQIDKSQLVKYKVTGDTRIFKRNVEEVQDIKVNMFETILIDRSGSMGDFEEKNSPLRNAIKAAIIRARTLEYFKVDFNIVFFDNEIEEVMTFGEKFSNKKTKIPAKLMRAAKKSGGTNISLPIIYTKEKLTEYSKKQGKRSLGNITFIGDGEPMSGFTGNELENLINDIKKKFPITAFYITGGSQHGTELERYFGKKETGGTVVIDDVSQLSKGIVETFNKNIKKTLRKIQKIK